MIKNNLKSLFLHITISIACVFVFLLFNSSQPKWVSEEAYRNHHIKMMIAAAIIFIAASILYFLIARMKFISVGNLYKNLVSVSLPTIIGGLLWILAFYIDLSGPSNILLNSELWRNYTLYNGYSLFLVNESGINNAYVFLLLSFLPTIIMGLGIRRKI